MCHVTPYAASAAHISRFAAPTFRCRPTGLTLHAGLEPYNRYRDLGKYFFINEKIFRTIEPGRPDLVVDTFKAGTALLPYVRCHDFLRAYRSPMIRLISLSVNAKSKIARSSCICFSEHVPIRG